MNNNVSIGSTTITGWTTAFTAFVSAGIVYLTGNQAAQEVTALEVAGMGLLTLVITQVFRYLQAHKLIGIEESVPLEEFPPIPAAAPVGKIGPPEAVQPTATELPAMPPVEAQPIAPPVV